LMLFGTNASATYFSDDFEDGEINDSLWVWGGAKRGWNPSNPSDTGNWKYSHKEITDPMDGYLQMRVHGPTSGNTYGAEAWIRTTQNFNDGNSWTINFTWEPEFHDSHYNFYHIQITDGYISPDNYIHWAREYDCPGTENLLWTIFPDNELIQGKGFYNAAMPGKLTWSITIDPFYEKVWPPPTYYVPVARLFTGPDGTGWELDRQELDLNYPWYVRFMVSDATSAYFPAGDTRLNLYSFEAIPEPTTILLLGLGGLAVIRKRRG